jgi:hypothetical protein
VSVQAQGGKLFYVGPLDSISSTVSIQDGDSGALVTWSVSRIGYLSLDVVGLLNAAKTIAGVNLYAYYQRLDHIQTAFRRAGVSYDHYWGTGSYLNLVPQIRPSRYGDYTDPLNPNPCSQ